MSPEQAEDREVGPPSDIFSLGAVLAYAATGAGPFGGGSTPALVYRVVHTQASVDDVPAEVRPLIERCLAKDPGRRPAARDLLAEAAAVLPGAGWLPEPVTRTFLQLPAQAGLPETVTSWPRLRPQSRRGPPRRLGGRRSGHGMASGGRWPSPPWWPTVSQPPSTAPVVTPTVTPAVTAGPTATATPTVTQTAVTTTPTPAVTQTAVAPPTAGGATGP